MDITQQLDKSSCQIDMAESNFFLINKSATSRIEWAMETLPENFVLSSSFGIQSAVMLHMMVNINANIPVILVDTGHLFPETYHFVEELTKRFQLNLQVYQAVQSPDEQQKRYGKLWEQGSKGLEKYHYLNKVEPFDRAMIELKAKTWFSGIRKQQTQYRKELSVFDFLRGHYKVHPIIDWTEKDVHHYMTKHHLPYHPLHSKGYISVGDAHSTKSSYECGTTQECRFSGQQEECGLHLK